MNSVLTVSQLNRYIAFRFKEDTNLKSKLVKGEISNFTHHQKSGHFYFTLKDGESAIKAVMFNSFSSALRFAPENGMEVIVMASVQVYERDGVYQLYVTDMQPSGVGALYLAFEQLKEKLSAEGIFAEEHKLALPLLPKKIGIVTSKTGAALQDILNILERRYPIGTAEIFPTLVQGTTAPAAICAALKIAGASDCDVIILGRGGGSLEDLSAFNNEAVARAIYACKTPIISAVGHETDTTIADFVADMHAPTPSAAAELVAPDKNNLQEMLQKACILLYNNTLQQINRHQTQLNRMAARFSALRLDERITSSESRLREVTQGISHLTAHLLQQKTQSLAEKSARLTALDPLAVLLRGYALAFKEDALVLDAATLTAGDAVRIKFSSGEAFATITKIQK